MSVAISDEASGKDGGTALAQQDARALDFVWQAIDPIVVDVPLGSERLRVRPEDTGQDEWLSTEELNAFLLDDGRVAIAGRGFGRLAPDVYSSAEHLSAGEVLEALQLPVPRAKPSSSAKPRQRGAPRGAEGPIRRAPWCPERRVCVCVLRERILSLSRAQITVAVRGVSHDSLRSHAWLESAPHVPLMARCLLHAARAHAAHMLLTHARLVARGGSSRIGGMRAPERNIYALSATQAWQSVVLAGTSVFPDVWIRRPPRFSCL